MCVKQGKFNDNKLKSFFNILWRPWCRKSLIENCFPVKENKNQKKTPQTTHQNNKEPLYNSTNSALLQILE